MNKPKERKTADRIFEEWKASLANKDKSTLSLLENFDALFEDMQYANIDPDIAEEYVKPAITAHLPTKFITRLVFKKQKEKYPDTTESEFFESWKRIIEDNAKQAYFFRFPIPKEEKKADGKSNAMSKEEYVRQRRYANSFPSLDLSKIPDIEDNDDSVSFTMADLGD